MISNFAIQAKVIPYRDRRLSTLTRPPPVYPPLDRVRSQRPDAKVVINVGGRRFVTWKNTLKRFPQTLLGCDELAARFYDKDKDEYFIDRDPHLFRYILNYYRCGKLHRSHEDCIASFEEELEFYGIRPQEIHDCCFDEDHDNREELDKSAKLDETCPEKNNELEVERWFFSARQQIWILLEGDAESGIRAVVGMAIIYIIGLFIILSIFTTMYETVPCNSDEKVCMERFRVLGLLDLICIGVFTVEFVLRLSVCPDYRQFVKNPMNLIDLLSILPFYLTLLLQSVVGSNLDAFLVLRVLRIFRVFKLTRHSKRLQRFGAALMTCLVDLVSLIFVLVIAIVLFASVLYFIERKAVEGKFTSIPDSMWYTIVTMITLG